MNTLTPNQTYNHKKGSKHQMDHELARKIWIYCSYMATQIYCRLKTINDVKPGYEPLVIKALKIKYNVDENGNYLN